MLTKKISLPLALMILLTGIQVPINGQEFFSDIQDHVYQEAIQQLYMEGYVEGVGNGMYRPDDFLTNAQAIQLAVNIFDLNLDRFRFIKEPLASDYFLEADNDAWYAKAFVIIGANGVALDRALKPNEPIRPMEFERLFRLEGGPQVGELIEPDSPLKRGEAAMILVQSLDYLKAEGHIVEKEKAFDASLDAKVGRDSVEFIFDIHNQTESDQVISFSSSQTFDFNVYNSDGDQVYNWASVRSFLTVITDVAIEKEGYVRYETPWDYTDASGQKLPAGAYKVVFTSQFKFGEEPIELSSEVLIDIP